MQRKPTLYCNAVILQLKSKGIEKGRMNPFCNAGDVGLIPGRGAKTVLQVKILHDITKIPGATTKT